MSKIRINPAQPLAAYLTEASKAYGRGIMESYFDLATGKERRRPPGGGGDPLAQFVGIEISELYDPKVSDQANRTEFIRALGVARDEINKVVAHFEKTLGESL